ncbi:MAG: hypothetical protein ACRDTS_01825 [Mycobacterium sp.]
MAESVTVGLLVRIEALPGRADDVLFDQPSIEQVDVLAEKPPT